MTKDLSPELKKLFEIRKAVELLPNISPANETLIKIKINELADMLGVNR